MTMFNKSCGKISVDKWGPQGCHIMHPATVSSTNICVATETKYFVNTTCNKSAFFQFTYYFVSL